MSNDAAYMREYMRERYHRRRAAAIDQLGGRCADCGAVDDLEFDHADRTNKVHNLAKILAGGSETKVQAELAKCVLRCRPCHEAKSRAAGDYLASPELECCGMTFNKQALGGHRRWHCASQV